MKHTSFKLALTLILIFFLNACASGQISQSASFSDKSHKALVIMGVNIQPSVKSPYFLIRKYDPISGLALKPQTFISQSDRDLSAGQIFASHFTGQEARPKGHNYFVFELDPGNWFIERVNTSHSNGFSSTITSTILSGGTITFYAEPGKILYLGELDINSFFAGGHTRLTIRQPNLDGAKLYLKLFPNIQGDVLGVTPRTSSFHCSLLKSSPISTCKRKYFQLETNKSLLQIIKR